MGEELKSGQNLKQQSFLLRSLDWLKLIELDHIKQAQSMPRKEIILQIQIRQNKVEELRQEIKNIQLLDEIIKDFKSLARLMQLYVKGNYIEDIDINTTKAKLIVKLGVYKKYNNFRQNSDESKKFPELLQDPNIYEKILLSPKKELKTIKNHLSTIEKSKKTIYNIKIYRIREEITKWEEEIRVLSSIHTRTK